MPFSIGDNQAVPSFSTERTVCIKQFRPSRNRRNFPSCIRDDDCDGGQIDAGHEGPALTSRLLRRVRAALIQRRQDRGSAGLLQGGQQGEKLRPMRRKAWAGL